MNNLLATLTIRVELLGLIGDKYMWKVDGPEGRSKIYDKLPEDLSRVISALDAAGSHQDCERVGFKISNNVYWLHQDCEKFVT